MRKISVFIAAAGMVLTMGSVAMAYTTIVNTMSATATLVPSCSVSHSTMDFGTITALVGTGDRIADTGTSLLVACTSGTLPKIWSATSRILASTIGNTIAFNLSKTSGAANDDLPYITGADVALTTTPNGVVQTEHIYGKLLATNFGGLPADTYTKDIVLNVEY